MKKLTMITSLVAGSLFLTLLYSCVKEGLAGDDFEPIENSKTASGAPMNEGFTNSGCTICNDHKEAVLTNADFYGPYTGTAGEMNYRWGSGTISDPLIQSYRKVNVSIVNNIGRETALPFFAMAADGSYESINYQRGSSFLTIMYVRYNKATNSFTYKPLNNLTVRYGISFISGQ